jgi:hypothetical protein
MLKSALKLFLTVALQREATQRIVRNPDHPVAKNWLSLPLDSSQLYTGRYTRILNMGLLDTIDTVVLVIVLLGQIAYLTKGTFWGLTKNLYATSYANINSNRGRRGIEYIRLLSIFLFNYLIPLFLYIDIY